MASSLCLCLCVQISFSYKAISHTGLGGGFIWVHSSSLDCTCKGYFQRNHIHRDQGLGLQHVFVGDIIHPLTTHRMSKSGTAWLPRAGQKGDASLSLPTATFSLRDSSSHTWSSASERGHLAAWDQQSRPSSPARPGWHMCMKEPSGDSSPAFRSPRIWVFPVKVPDVVKQRQVTLTVWIPGPQYLSINKVVLL